MILIINSVVSIIIIITSSSVSNTSSSTNYNKNVGGCDTSSICSISSGSSD